MKMTFLIEKLKAHKINSRFSIVITVIILFMLVLILISTLEVYKKSNYLRNNSLAESKNNKFMLNKLNEINNSVAIIRRNSTNKKQQDYLLHNIEQNIQSLIKADTDTAKLSDIKTVTDQLSTVKDHIDMRMDNLKKTIFDTLGEKQYLDASELPFDVISVDVIAGQPYVTVNYNKLILPLAIGDTLAEWHLNITDYVSTESEFENGKKQFIKVKLKGI